MTLAGEAGDRGSDRVEDSGSSGLADQMVPWITEHGQSGLVSVIIPTFNRAALIVESLDSVRRQAYRPIEIIVIDDGSSDDTEQVVRSWASKHADGTRLTLVYLRQDRRGAPAARNRGLRESRGEFIQFLDSDDLLHPRKIDLHVAALQRDTAAHMVYSPIGSFTNESDWGGVPYGGREYVGDDVLVAFLRGGLWQTICAMYRRSACIEIGPWDEELPIMQDWDYNIRLILQNPRIAFVPSMLALHRWVGEDRITAARTSKLMLGGMLVGQKRWDRLIRASGRMDSSVAEALAELAVGVAAESLRQGHRCVAQDAIEFATSLEPTGPVQRELRRVRLAAALPSPVVSLALMAKRHARARLQG